jgi:hypothetical protein
MATPYEACHKRKKSGKHHRTPELCWSVKCPIQTGRYRDYYRVITMEKRTARLTLLVDPNKKIAFEQLCAQEDVTPSQKIRQFMRDYIEEKMGSDWRDKVLSDDTNKPVE